MDVKAAVARTLIVGLGLAAVLAAGVGTPTSALGGVAAQGACEIPTDRLVSWWDGEGDGNDVAGGNDGILIGTIFESAVVGQGFRFDGVDDEVRVADHPTLDNTGELSLAFWARTDRPLALTGQQVIDHQYLLDKRTGFGLAAGYMICFDCFPSGEISFGFGDGSTGNYVSSNGLTVDTGTYYFFAATASRSGDFVRIYQDGALIANGSWGAVGSVTNNNPLLLGHPNGCCTNTLGVLDGVLDEVRMFDRALTSCEVEAIFREGQPAATVAIDIKPGSDPNSINLRGRGKGVIPVAILTDNSFDATTVDPLTVRFAGAEVAHPHVAGGHPEDVDGDGDVDLVLHFTRAATSLACGDTAAALHGETTSGDAFEGSDAIRTVGC